MIPLPRLAPLLLLPLLLPAACGGEPESAKPPKVGSLESLLPDDAMALFRLRSLNVLKEYADLGPIPADPLPRLAQMFGFDVATADRTQPLAVTLAPTTPTPTLVLPLLEGGYRSLSMGVLGASGNCPLAAAIPDADLFARVDVTTLNANYRPMLEGLLGMVQGRLGQPGMGGPGELASALDLARALLDGCAQSELIVRREGGTLHVSLDFLMKEDATPDVRELPLLHAHLARDFTMLAGGGPKAARAMAGLWGDTSMVQKLAERLTGGWMLGVDGPRLALVGHAENAAAVAEGFDLPALAAALGLPIEEIHFKAAGTLFTLHCGFDPEEPSSGELGLPATEGVLAAFLRVGAATATLSGEGRTWRLRLSGDPKELRILGRK